MALLLVAAAQGANAVKTMDIEEVRQKLESVKANYKGKDAESFNKAIDNAVASLQAQYGTQVPQVEVIKLLRKIAIPYAEAETVSPRANDVTGKNPKEVPDGVSVESTPDGFVLRVSTRSLFTVLFWTFGAVVLIIIPVRLFPDLIRGLPADTGLSFWLTSAFLALWAGGALYGVWRGTQGVCGEIRIVKSGDRGEIFTGIGKLGRAHRVRWSDYYGAGDREVSTSSGRSSRTEHFIGLNGRSTSYRFGSELNSGQQAFVIAFLRKKVFGLAHVPEGDSAMAPGTGDGKTVSVEHLRQTLEKAKGNYHGPDPEAFSRSADELVSSLKARYGERAPIPEALRGVEALGQMPGAQIHFTF